MRFTLSRVWRRRLTNVTLWLADQLPPGTGKMIARLQQLARERAERARGVVESITSKPYSLKYIGFSLVELFPNEVRQDVIDGARSLFASIDSERFGDTRTVWYGQLVRLYRARPPGFFISPDSATFVPTLPAWVAYIDLSIVEHSPSAFMIVADVATNDQVDEVLRIRMTTETRPIYELHDLRHVSRLGYSYSRSSATTAFADKFQAALAALRGDIQYAVFDRLGPRGYFLSHEKTLPAIELLEVAGGDVPAEAWLDATSSWLYTLGLRLDRDYYSSENVIVSTARDSDADHPPVWRVAFRPDYKPPAIGTVHESRGEIARALHENLHQTLRSLATTAHHEILRSLLQRFRRQVYLSRRRRFDIAAQVALYEEIFEERTFFLRSKRDFEDRAVCREQNTFLHAMRYRSAFQPNVVEVKPADEALRDGLSWMYGRLAKGIEEIHTSYSDVLAARNWRATNRLSRRATYISTASVIVAVLFGTLRTSGNAPSQWYWPNWHGTPTSSSPQPTVSHTPRVPKQKPAPKPTLKPKRSPSPKVTP